MMARLPVTRLAVLLLASIALGACGPPLKTNEAAAPLSATELANATYPGMRGQPVTLHEGYWEGAPFVPGGASRPRAGLLEAPLLQGDLDGDGRVETVAFPWISEGGTGTDIYLAILTRRDGRPVSIASVRLGDRVQIREARIENQQILLYMVQHGVNDAACCPGDKVLRRWRLVGEQGGPVLRELPARRQGRLSLADLEDTDWRLVDKPEAPEGLPSITLRFEDRRLGGSSGCNRYTAEVSGGELPGTLRIGAVAGTRMACEDEFMAREDRYLKRLSRATRFAFRPGQLLLTVHNGDSRPGLLTFTSHHPDEEASHARQQ